jgi:hypothetical protein
MGVKFVDGGMKLALPCKMWRSFSHTTARVFPSEVFGENRSVRHRVVLPSHPG